MQYPASLAAILRAAAQGFKQRLGILQTEKHIPRRRRDRDAIGAARRGDGIAVQSPRIGIRKRAGLLQVVSACIRPGDDDAVPGTGDAQLGQICGLDHSNQAPETARHRVLATGHCPARIRLADGAAHGVTSVAAGAAAAGNFIPVNGILGVRRQRHSGNCH